MHAPWQPFVSPLGDGKSLRGFDALRGLVFGGHPTSSLVVPGGAPSYSPLQQAVFGPHAAAGGADAAGGAVQAQVFRRVSRGLVVVTTTDGGTGSGGGGGGDMLVAETNAEATTTNVGVTLAYDTWLRVVATSTIVTVTLPAPALSSGKSQFVGLRVDPSSTKTVLLLPSGMEKIDGAGSRVLWAGESAVLKTNGTDWFKVAGKSVPMQCSLSLSASQGVNTAGVEVIVALDTVDSDNTGLMADTTNHRVLFKRSGNYVVCAQVSYAADNTDSVPWAATTGAACNVANNAGTGGPYFASARGLAIGGTQAAPGVFATAAVAGTAGNYVALTAYCGGANYSVYVAAPQGATLQVIEIPSW